ncbi:MAG: translation initiation factor IF-2, partial [Candidatus Omnitrophica bacterium]|nr:translation initiation factor IF-2 [Candidatus Omnitrophota bacterium]
LVASGVKVLRPGVTGPAAPIIRKPTTPAASSVSRPAAKPSTGTAAKPKAAKPKEEKETPGEERDFRRTGTESKARDLLRTKRLRESGIKPKSAVEPPPAPTPAPEMEEPQPPAMEAAPTPEPPRAVEETPTPPPTPISQARSAPVQTPDSRPARRPSQASGGQQGHQGQRPRRGDQGQQQRKGPRSGETRSQQRAALETAPPPAATPATPPPAAASDAKGKKGKGKKERPVEEVEVRKDRDSSVSERKVLASIMGRKKGKKQQYKRAKKERFAAAEEAVREREEKERTTLRIHEATTVADVAHGLGVNPSAILKILLDLGKILTVNQHLDRECIDLIAEEFGFDVEETSLMEINPFEELEQEDRPEDLRPRPPVVTVMGHVDHGKTKLMDAIRSADVASGEAGGITQHLGAYFVQLDSGPITFIDTPGHEAFTAMRARGAMVTDVVVLVVAADDGVMPQTREAISHARAAGVPILVAINKIDVQGANVDRVKQQLAAEGLVPEDWGGTTPVAEISALRKQGIGQLVELIHLQAELLELKANPDKCAKGTVLEARLEQGRGVIVTALVQEGTLRVGDPIVAGVYAGKVRALLNEHTLRVEEAVPGVPVAILGLSGAPVAGDEVRGVPDEKTARELSGKLQQIRREREMIRRGPVSLESLFSRIEEGSVKDLNVIIKGDVQGSVEAVCESLQGIESEKVRVRILHRGVGAVSESDVMLASASDALILGFNVVVPAEVAALQQREKVDIRIYRIIYDAIEDIKKAMMGLLADEVHEIVVGHFEVMQIFRSSKAGLIIGGQVSDGKIIRGRNVRVLRDGKVIHEGKLSTLRRFKDEVNEVPSGLECGVGIEGLQDIRERDVLECYQMETVAATL